MLLIAAVYLHLYVPSSAESSAGDLLMFDPPRDGFVELLTRARVAVPLCFLFDTDLTRLQGYSTSVLQSSWKVFLWEFVKENLWFFLFVQPRQCAAPSLGTWEIHGKFLSFYCFLKLRNDRAHGKPSGCYKRCVFLPSGEDVVVAGPVPASHLLGSAIGAHVCRYNQERPSARLRQQPHPAQLRRGRHRCRRRRGPGDVCSRVRKGKRGSENGVSQNVALCPLALLQPTYSTLAQQQTGTELALWLWKQKLKTKTEDGERSGGWWCPEAHSAGENWCDWIKRL